MGDTSRTTREVVDALKGVDRRRTLDEEVAKANVLRELFSFRKSSERTGTPKLGRYVLRRRLGSGGLGIVFEAFDPQLDRCVALKLLRSSPYRNSERGRQRLVREAQVLATLAHPNVVGVFDVGIYQRPTDFEAGDLAEIPDEGVFIVMELVEGEELGIWGRAPGRSPGEALEALLQAGRGLAAAHAIGIVHRDFKPANVLIGRDGRSRVLDFGLASATGGATAPQGETTGGASQPSLTESGKVLGTPAYMAPEQHFGRQCDAKADQYSFCVALYEALAGQHPFPGSTAIEIAERKLRGPALPRKPPRVLRAAWPTLRRGLSVSTNARFPDMHALLRDLVARVHRRRLRWIVATVVAGAAVMAALWTPGATCQDAPESDAWPPQRRAAAAAAFASVGREHSWSRIESHLEPLATRWSTLYADACEAGRDQHMACLRRWRAGLTSLGDAWSSGHAGSIDAAASAAIGLGSPQECLAAHRGRPRPGDPRLAAEVDAAREALVQVPSLAKAGSFHEAERAIESALLLEFPPLKAEALNRYGAVHLERGEYVEAQAKLTEAYWLAIDLGDDAVASDAAGALVHAVGYGLNRYDEARQWARHAHSALERSGKGDEALAVLLVREAGVLALQHDLAQAHAMQSRAIALMTKARGPDSLTVATMRANRAGALLAQGRFAEARADLESALATKRRWLGDDHPGLVMQLSNLGSVLRQQGRLEEALRRFRRALAILRSNQPGHPAVGHILTGLGSVYEAQGKLAKARAHLEQALATYRSAPQANAGFIANTLGNLGGVLSRQGELELGRQRLQEALEMRQRLNGDDHPDTAVARSNLAPLLAELGRVDEAIALLQHALEVLAAHTDPNHPNIAACHDRLAAVQLRKGDVRAARQHAERAVTIYEAGLDSNHPALAHALSTVAEVEAAAGRCAPATEALARAATIATARGLDPTLVAEAETALARAHCPDPR